MVLCNKELEDFATYVKAANKRIVAYAAGNIGACVVPPVLKSLGIDSYVDFYVDADVNKQGVKLEFYTQCVLVESVERLCTIKENQVIVITNAYFYPIIDLLDSMPCLDNIEVYVFPIMQMKSRNFESENIIRTSNVQLIPKTIHYCWFSKSEMPLRLKKCLETWSKYCPDYEIIRWDETNYDVTKYEYTRHAYENQKWSFLSDCARMDILYECGGIYLDTDVELIKSIDELLYVPAFISSEKFGQVNSGGAMGAQKFNSVIGEILDTIVNSESPYDVDNYRYRTNGYYETKVLVNAGLLPNNRTQKLENIVVYSSDFFHPLDYITWEQDYSENTFSIHQFSGTWVKGETQEARIKTHNKYQSILKRMGCKNE